MDPVNYLLLAAGLGLGVPIGYAISSIVSAFHIRRADRAAWAAANLFYTRRYADLLNPKN